ncbi:MAG: glycerate kinase, partial [Opitutaceae bacterium]|nr:glycerate kinase [Verrucomicrobiales bacterium]
QNPLLGTKGCSRIYGPQKGLRPQDFIEAEANLRRLARVLTRTTGFDAAKVPGAGAAGGLGFGLRGFFNADTQPGFEIFARAAMLRVKLRDVDLVITGEGSLDAQTLMGKGVGEIALLCRDLKIPCIGLAGHVPDPRKAKRLFLDVRALTEVTTLEEAKARPGRWLKQIAAMAATAWEMPAARSGKIQTLRGNRGTR